MAKHSNKPAPRLGPDARVAVLHGKDAFLRSMHTDHLREAIEAQGEEVDVIRFAGESVSAAEVLDECRTLGLLQQYKIVIVDQADEFLKERKDEADRPAGRGRKAPPRVRDLIQRYAESPCESVTLVLRAETWRKGNLDKAIEKVGSVVKCDAPSADKAAAWARKRAEARYERSLESDAAGALVDKLGSELGRLDSELAKLSSAVGQGEPITLALVHEMVGFTREETVWQIQELLLGGSAETTLSKMRELLTVSRVPTILCRYAMADLARKLHGASAALKNGASPEAIGSELRLWGPMKSKLLSVAREVPPGELARLLREAVELDQAAKSSDVDEVRDLERLALRFASVQR